MEEVGKRLNVTTLDQWYHVSLDQIYQHGAGSMLRHQYGSSLYNALKVIFAEHEWLPWSFDSTPKSTWASVEHRNRFREYAKEELRISKAEDWAAVTKQQIRDLGGSGLLAHFRGSKSIALTVESRDKDAVPPNRLREAFDSLLRDLHIERVISSPDVSEYYSIRASVIRKRLANGLLSGSPSVTDAIVSAYPEHNWIPWKFAVITSTMANSSKTQFLTWASRQLCVRSLEDWYTVSYRQLMELTADEDGIKRRVGAAAYLRLTDNSPSALIRAAFPEHQWDLARFNAMAAANSPRRSTTT